MPFIGGWAIEGSFNPDYPLANLRPVKDRRSGGIGPKAGDQARFRRGTESIRRFWEASLCQEPPTASMAKPNAASVGPEVPHVERIQAKVRLQFIDPVLCSCAASFASLKTATA